MGQTGRAVQDRARVAARQVRLHQAAHLAPPDATTSSFELSERLSQNRRLSTSGRAGNPSPCCWRIAVVNSAFIAGEANAPGRLLAAMLGQKSEHVISPDGGSKIAKSVAVLRRVAVGRINLHLSVQSIADALAPTQRAATEIMTGRAVAVNRHPELVA